MTPCFQHDSYRHDCGDCRDMNGDKAAAEQHDFATIYVSGETLARLRRISAIDGRSVDDLALAAVEDAACQDMRGDNLRSV